jgi:hypothetical protein
VRVAEHELAFFYMSFRAPNLDYGAGVCKLYHFVYEELKDCVYICLLSWASLLL